MKKTSKAIFIIIILMVFLVPLSSVHADPASSIADNNKETIDAIQKTTEESNKSESKKETVNQKDTMNCNYVFGDPNEDGSFANMIQKILNYAKVLAPLLVVLLSGIDFAKNAMSGDQDEMKKATKKLVTRLACAVGVFLAPFIASFLLNFINNSSVDKTCNIK